MTRLLKKQIYELKEQLYVKDNQIETLKKSINSSNYLVVSYERDEYQSEVYRLQKIIKDLKDYINIQKQRQHVINGQYSKPNHPNAHPISIPIENELKREIEQLKEGYNQILNNLQNPIKLSSKKQTHHSPIIEGLTHNEEINKSEQVIEKKIRTTSARRRRKLLLLKQAAINNKQTDSEVEYEDNHSAKSAGVTKSRKPNVNITADTFSSKVKRVEKPVEKLDLLNDKLKDLSKLEHHSDRRTPKASDIPNITEANIDKVDKPVDLSGSTKGDSFTDIPNTSKVDEISEKAITLDSKPSDVSINIDDKIIEKSKEKKGYQWIDNHSKITITNNVDKKPENKLEDLSSDYEVLTVPQVPLNLPVIEPVLSEPTIEPVIPLPKYEIDQAIEAMYYNGDTWYSGVIKTCYIITDNRYIYDILYDDGDRENKVPEERIRAKKTEVKNVNVNVVVVNSNNIPVEDEVNREPVIEATESQDVQLVDNNIQSDNFEFEIDKQKKKVTIEDVNPTGSYINETVDSSSLNKALDDTLSGYLNNLSDDDEYSIGGEEPKQIIDKSLKTDLHAIVTNVSDPLAVDDLDSPQVIRSSSLLINKFLDSKVTNDNSDTVNKAEVVIIDNTKEDSKIEILSHNENNNLDINEILNLGDNHDELDLDIYEDVDEIVKTKEEEKKSNKSSRKSLDPYETDGYEDDFD
eukprot:CAMPEP_0196765020 /NCGR_PEP_ID=MMETSP1095-20130614/7403_1 /TAXON_ID=96789 ORGANISM="Chromulina nebulosa, Strain UTEXLB2642" /NCGR_SAMPLE_ID=MMETSP1095 /ASSEMBLY_ACC=CAM_ASM_000446 /LENGTH=690 /DNA_ID=CAMNT_0042122181 /DNA_START=343 /DNA_END=2415 /DNA_ORIENTATION=+